MPSAARKVVVATITVPSDQTRIGGVRRRIAPPNTMPTAASSPMRQPKCGPVNTVRRNAATATASSVTRGPRRSISTANGVGTAGARNGPTSGR